MLLSSWDLGPRQYLFGDNSALNNFNQPTSYKQYVQFYFQRPVGARGRKRESVRESICTFRRVERSFTRHGNIVRRVARLPRSWLSFRTAAGTSRGSPETRSGGQSDLHGRLHNAATKEKDRGGSKRRPKAKLLLCQDCGRLETTWTAPPSTPPPFSGSVTLVCTSECPL